MVGAIRDSRLREGCLIDRRILLEERLGEGAVGDVWRAKHLELGSSVAVKLLPSRFLASSGRHVASFLHEASLPGRVDCPHVVRVMECRLSLDLGPYIVTELLEGMDLFEHLAREGALEIDQAAGVVAQLCIALEALHAADVFHRDVKPENIVVSLQRRRLHATLIDFNLARDGRAPIAEIPGSVVGTPAYLSPERLGASSEGEAPDDLWALAVVGYQCMVGQVPFDDTTFDAVSAAVDRAEFAPPSALRPDVPRAVDAWFRRAFSRSRAERFASAAEMRETLLAACSPFSRALPADDTTVGHRDVA
jgi:serine/threonine protein kinase